MIINKNKLCLCAIGLSDMKIFNILYLCVTMSKGCGIIRTLLQNLTFKWKHVSTSFNAETSQKRTFL